MKSISHFSFKSVIAYLTAKFSEGLLTRLGNPSLVSKYFDFQFGFKLSPEDVYVLFLSADHLSPSVIF